MSKSILVASVWLVSLAGCGSVGGGSVDANGRDAGSDAATDVLQALCNPVDGMLVDWMVHQWDCNPGIEAFVGYRPGRDELSALCRGVFQPYVEDGSVVTSPAALADCRAWVNELAQTCGDPRTDEANPCANALQGQQPMGGACNDDVQCSGDSYCQQGVGCGSCRPRLADGAGPCVRNEQCSSRYCRLNGAPGVCAQHAGLNQPCATNADCGGLHVCGPNNTCQDTPVMGSRCADHSDCRNPELELYCSPSPNNVCAAVKAPNAACASGAECNYLRGSLCPNGQCTQGTTVGPNQPCGLDVGIVCMGDLVCAGSPPVCKTHTVVSDPCNAATPCTGFAQSCVLGRCQYGLRTGMCPP